MKAWVLHGINDLRYETIADPVISAREVLVSVKAAGICGSDIPRIYQTGAHTHPLIPGHEFAGVVTGIGAEVDTAWMGARVGVFPLIPCKECAPCKKKQYEMCRNYSYLGSRRDGGFAECVAVPADNLIRLPDNVTYEEAAMLEPMAVAVHAMRKVAPLESERIAICGLGTIGLFLLMFLLESGRKNILAIGNKEFQRQMAVKLGLAEECYCDSKSQDVDKWLTERTGGSGTDVFFECVGRNETITQAVRLTGAAGRIMLVGNPATDMKLDKEVYWKILRNQLTVMGTWNSSFTHDREDDWHYVLDRLKDNRIAPAELITHRFALTDLYRGFEVMRDKSEEYGKIMGINPHTTMNGKNIS
ncbi:MAG: galactitol-1-phosphate 5-dehydrogenase [Lachnospiraceae bacterium]|nr:galactitol-1-phosphate 5-dehydrogenase [Lachnospiraceae bacterium]